MESVLLLNDNNPIPTEVEFPLGKITFFSRKASYRGEGEKNQDSAGVFFRGKSAVLVVADGMGGHEGGELASKLVVETFQKELENSNNWKTEIVSIIEKCNELILKEISGAATTLCVSLVEEDSVRFYNLGDSTGLLLGRGGELKHKCHTHSAKGLIELSGVDASKIDFKEDGDHLMSGLGFENYFLDVYSPKGLKQHDVILLASDGFSDNLTMDEIISGWQESGLMGKMKFWTEQSLTRMESEEGHKDDFTFVAFQKNI